jgi:hypothetical protein
MDGVSNKLIQLFILQFNSFKSGADDDNTVNRVPPYCLAFHFAFAADLSSFIGEAISNIESKFNPKP